MNATNMATSKPSPILDDDQKFTLMKFRRNIADIIQPHFTDQFLLRWLRARSWDVEAAEKMLRQSMRWRKQWEVDGALRTWQPPEALALYYPSGVCGYDKDGSPVIVVPFAGLDIVGLLHSVPRQDMIKLTIKIIEDTLDVAKANNLEQLVVIFDMDEWNIRQYAWRPAAEVVISLIKMYEANYPEILKTCFIINAPRVFTIAFNVVKRFLNEYTISKMQIFKNDPRKWQKAILELVDANNLPKHFGGNLVDPDGNPRFTTKVRQGGKVPKSYYTKKFDETEIDDKHGEFKTIILKNGEKTTLDFIVAEDGCFLRWEFHTEGHDIRFGISVKDIDGNVHTAVSHRRVAAHQIDESGVLACQFPATYSVTFDNSYSLMRNKKIHYNIAVTPPLEKMNILPTDGEEINGSPETGTGSTNASTSLSQK